MITPSFIEQVDTESLVSGGVLETVVAVSAEEQGNIYVFSFDI